MNSFIVGVKNGILELNSSSDFAIKNYLISDTDSMLY